jgi:1,4-dihydroxy-2-naphthoate octaprenyltransferase
MTRPAFLTATVVAVAIGLASAHASGVRLSPALAFATLLLAVLAHAAANVLNDYADAVNGADAANTGGIAPFTGGAGLIARGEVDVAQTRRFALALLGACALGGIALALWLRLPAVWAIGGVGLGLGWAYSMPPLRLMTRRLGEATVAAAWWLVAIGADLVQRGHVDLLPIAAAAGYALLVADLLLVNGLPDADGDARAGKRTLAVALGPRGAARLYAAIALLAHATVVVGVARHALPATTLWSLATLPLALFAAREVARHAATPQQLRPAIVATLATLHLHGALMAAALFAAPR